MPGRLALAGDGSLWMTGEYGGITRLSPSGSAKVFLPRDEFISDVAVGPDRAVWAADDVYVARIAASGRTRRWRVGGHGLADAITSAGDSIWVAVEGNGGRGMIERIGRDGTRRQFAIASPRQAFTFRGIAGAPDGTVWFTESGDRNDWIGRMTEDGHYSHWALPRTIGDPGRIAAGPDGAMWFTGTHAVGRISFTGEVTSFPLGGGLAPHDITAGPDAGLWFTNDICLARITSSGEVATWPVPGAVQLEGIASAGDGSFWLADRLGNAVRHFTPSAAAPAPCGAPTLARRAGHTTVTLSFQRIDRFDRIDYFTDIHVHITRAGIDAFSEAVPRLRGNAAFSNGDSVTVRDLDGDGEPEVMLLLDWGGNRCCAWSRIYRYDPARSTFVAQNHFWGNYSAAPELLDLNADRRPEFISADDRFTERFTGYAGSMSPIQIWSYTRGHFRDVTRRYPRIIRRDAAQIWRVYAAYRTTDARGILPAWMADEYLLGRRAHADRVLARAAARGDLENNHGIGPRGSQAYIRAVKSLLRRTGYSG